MPFSKKPVGVFFNIFLIFFWNLWPLAIEKTAPAGLSGRLQFLPGAG
jgi:hypothetical protein